MNSFPIIKYFNIFKDRSHRFAQSVIETSGELVRSTKFSKTGTHAQDYVEVVQKRAGNITGMGIRYGKQGLPGSRLFDFEVYHGVSKTRLYSFLDYTQFTRLLFGERKAELNLPEFVKVIQISNEKCRDGYWTENSPYINQVVLVRPDSYIESVTSLDQAESLFSLPQFYNSNRESHS